MERKQELSSPEILIRRLEDYRARYRLNYRELAAKLNIPYTTLIEILHKNRIPRFDTVDMIAASMKLLPYELIMPFPEEMADLEEDKYKNILMASVWQMSRRKRRMLAEYLRMLQECSFIQ